MVERRDPRLTVVVPAWNLGSELVECVQSIVSQDVPAHLLVVDNASERPLPEVGAEWIRLPRRLSAGAARNAGLEHVFSELVFFMDGDDVLLPGTFRHLLGLLDARPELVAAAGAIVLWDSETDRRIPSYYPPRVAYRLQRRPRLFALANVGVNMFPAAGSTVIHTVVAKRCGGFADRDELENWALGTSLALCGPVALSSRPCKLYRARRGEASLKNRAVGRVGAAWEGRAEVRRRFRRHVAPRSPARLLEPVYLAVHAAQTVREARAAPPRYMRLLGLASPAPDKRTTS